MKRLLQCGLGHGINSVWFLSLFVLFVCSFVCHERNERKCLPRVVVRTPREVSVLWRRRRAGGLNGDGAGLSVPMGWSYLTIHVILPL